MVLGVVPLSYKEMDEVTVLVFLCIAMLAGCYIVGNIPLIVSMSEEKLHMVSVLGAGLLVGTALAVIIPEGVHSLYSSRVGQHDHAEQHAADLTEPKSGLSTDAADHLEGHLSIHSLIGLALVLGFVFMLIVEQVFGGHGSVQDVESINGSNRSRFTATLGLVVHAAADGVALGAAATTSRADVEMIVFIAIMLHKAPAAFGLVTFLMHAGMDRSRIRRHLLIFALAAPVFALITYFGISQEGKQTLTSVNATGAAMLFSAGTFLYVSTIHVLPEVAYKTHDSRGLGKAELVALVLGALAPVLLSIGHQH